MIRSAALRGAALVAAGAALLAAAPAPAAALQVLRTAGSAGDPTAPLVAGAALVAELLLAWLVLVAVATAGSRLPGLAGSVGRRVAGRLAPVAVRRALELALGLGVAVGSVGVVPAAASPGIPPAPPAATSLDWPTADRPLDALPARPAPLTEGIDWPAVGSAVRSTPAPSATAPVLAAPAHSDLVTVRPGDSLWSVAADHLPPGAGDAQIAAAWPTWWAANRDAVGADPDLIHPGLSLRPPAQS